MWTAGVACYEGDVFGGHFVYVDAFGVERDTCLREEEMRNVTLKISAEPRICGLSLSSVGGSEDSLIEAEV